MYTLLGATLALTACVEDDKDLSQPKEPEKTTDLVIPDDADWTTTRTVSYTHLADHGGRYPGKRTADQPMVVMGPYPAFVLHQAERRAVRTVPVLRKL